MVQQASDKRLFSRVSCHSDATHADSGILLGIVRDVGLHGAFVSTDAPLPIHSVFALRFSLDDNDVQAEAEVVRSTENGMGLRFISQSREDSKKLRRYVVGAVGNMAYRDVVEQMHDAGASITEPLTGAKQIEQLLRNSQDSSFLILTRESPARHNGKMYHMTAETVGLLCDDECSLKKDDEIFVLYTKDYESYSFRTTVSRASGRLCEMHIPTGVLYSERRSSRRNALPDAVFSFAAGDGSGAVEYEVLETSEHGFSVRVNARSVDLWPGVLLPDASLFADGKRQTLANVVVQHVTRKEDPDGTEWFRVGLAHGRTQAAFDEGREIVSTNTARLGIRDRIARKVKGAIDGAVYLAHSRLLPQIVGPKEEARVLDIANARGKPLVCLLNTSWKPTHQRVKATVVLVTPGYGARKETMGAFAYMLTHLFEQEGRQVAVLRFDGVNNVGESYKEPGCNIEGKETMKFTVSDGVDDVAGAYAWAESNTIVDPTDIIVVSVSMSAIATRHALANQRLKDVSLWIPFMGAADAANAVMNVGGHVDGYSNYLKGIKNGVVSLAGNLSDADHCAQDMQELKVATLDDAKRDMAAIDADVLWIAGTHDAYMDIRRTRQLLAVPSKRRRQLIEVDAGHVPQSSEEAMAEFAIISKAILKHVQVPQPKMELPALGWIGAMTEREWRRVRKTRDSEYRSRWWKNQLEGGEKTGEILEFAPDYNALMDLQRDLVPGEAKSVVDLGCGWGTLTRKVLERPQTRVTAVDFGDAPLKRLKKIFPNDRLTTLRASIDGNAVIGLRRWVQGELPDVGEAIKTLPGERQKQVLWLAGLNDSRVHMAMRGNDIDMGALAQSLAMSPANLEGMKDMNALARFATGRLDASDLKDAVSPSVREALRGAALLPFDNDSVDCVTCSLVINYLERPEDTISEAYRMLKKSGRLVISAYVEDADMSEIYMALVTQFEKDGPKWPYPKKDLVEAARKMNTVFSQMRHLEEEGTFGKFNAQTLKMMVAQAGFVDTTATLAFGTPGRVVVVSGSKP